MQIATKNLKTTLMGILALIMLGFTVYKNPSALTDPTQAAQIAGAAAAGIGLILAKDGSQADAPAPPKQ
ncbi:MAG: hypothetical protein ACLQGV_08250 [Bryobacteraceae bacterium]